MEENALPQESDCKEQENELIGGKQDFESVEKLKENLNAKEQDYEKRLKDLIRREREFFKSELKSKALEKLKKSSIPFEAIDLVRLETEENMEKSIALLEKLLKRNALDAPVTGEAEISPTSYKQRAAAYIRNNFQEVI